ncbi:MAG: 50S ribosomal protein L10 [Proteobacteria bacterium]|nr:50S ribosomal protein L10 [Pseudomonadota bacterium]
MNKKEKQIAVIEMRETLKRYDSIILARNYGMNVIQSTKLRRLIKKDASGTCFFVKNKLAKIAIQETSHAHLADFFSGVIVVSCANDLISAAKTLKDFSHSNDNKIDIVAGVSSGRIINDDSIKRISSFISEDNLRATLLSLVKEPASSLVRLLNARFKTLDS